MNFFRNLGTREKIFVTTAGVAVLLALLFMFVIDPMLAHSARLDRQLLTVQRELKNCKPSNGNTAGRNGAGSDQCPAQTPAEFCPFSRLEELAGQTGIRSKIQYMKPIVSTPSDAYEEESVEIKMEGITLEQFIQYLYQIENSPQFMKIKRLHIKPGLTNRQILSVIFRVSTFTPKEGTS